MSLYLQPRVHDFYCREQRMSIKCSIYSCISKVVSKSGAACVTTAILISLCCRMDKDMKGWFTEINDLWAGQAMSLQVDEILHHEKSQYQDILVFNRCVQVDSTLQMRIISPTVSI